MVAAPLYAVLTAWAPLQAPAVLGEPSASSFGEHEGFECLQSRVMFSS